LGGASGNNESKLKTFAIYFIPANGRSSSDCHSELEHEINLLLDIRVPAPAAAPHRPCGLFAYVMSLRIATSDVKRICQIGVMPAKTYYFVFSSFANGSMVLHTGEGI